MHARLAALALTLLAAASNVSGTWEVKLNFDDRRLGGGGFYCYFRQNGERLTGTCSGESSQVTGSITGQTVNWQVQPRGSSPSTATRFTGTLNAGGNGISGRFTVADKSGSYTATKQ